MVRSTRVPCARATTPAPEVIDLAPDDPSLLCDGVAFDPDADDASAPVAPYEIVLGGPAPAPAFA